jgi:rubrerythrin
MKNTSFDIREVLQFALTIEEQGAIFYREAAARFGSPGAPSVSRGIGPLFAALAAQEDQHRVTFARMLGALADFVPAESYPEEYFAYLKAFADRLIFTTDAKRSLPAAPTALQCLDFALQRELDSILYYQEIQIPLVREQTGMLHAIIEEERRHFLQLSRQRESLVKTAASA